MKLSKNPNPINGIELAVPTVEIKIIFSIKEENKTSIIYILPMSSLVEGGVTDSAKKVKYN